MKKKDKNAKPKISCGIYINDSITLSVSKKQNNCKKTLSAILAVMGFVSVLQIFFSMFDVYYDSAVIVFLSVVLSLLYGGISLVKGKTVWLIPVTLILYLILSLLNVDNIVMGFKCVYNEIYRVTNYTNIDYFKEVRHCNELFATTVFLIFCIWLAALVTYFFTIHTPSPVAVLCVGFPVLEIGLYFGIAVPVFWTSLLIAYWFAVLSIRSCDAGEFDGGVGGFTRKKNLFFPKKNMKFKVTEKCAMHVVASIMTVALLSVGFLSMINFKRSEELNRMRSDLKMAFENFSMNNFLSSLSNVTEVFGFTIDYEDNRLGQSSSINYRNLTDLNVTFSDSVDHAVYLKGDVKSVYKNSEWSDFEDSLYDEYLIFKQLEIDQSAVNPLCFPYNFNLSLCDSKDSVYVYVNNKRNKVKTYTPYGISGLSGETFIQDRLVEFDPQAGYYCAMTPLNLSESAITLNNGIAKTKNNPYNARKYESEYRDFVHENYLHYPASDAMDEVYSAYEDILKNADTSSPQGILDTLDSIRSRIGDSCTYSTAPGKTPNNRDFINYFLLENKKGYCVNFATSGVILARMAGIPARYATGYIITEEDFDAKSKNADGSYTVNVQDNRSHAWTEIYIDGYGWIPYEFTTAYIENINSTETATENATTTATATTLSTNSNQTGSKQTSTSVTVTTAAKNAAPPAKGKSDSGNQNKLRIQLAVILSSATALTVGIILIRRHVILKRRVEHWAGKNPKKTARRIYRHVERQLRQLSIRHRNGSYADFVKEADETLADIYGIRNFKEFMDIALKSEFSLEKLNADEIALAKKFASELSAAVYNKSNPLRKIYYKFIYVN